MPFEEQLPQWDAPGVEPPASKKSTGWQAGEKPPADYWNWQMHRTYKALEELQQKAAEKEDVATKADLNAHANTTTGVHGATSAATPNTIVQRDSAGRFKAAAPSAADDVARKAEVDAALERASTAVNAGYNEDPNTTQKAYIVTNHANSPIENVFWHIRTFFYSSTTGNRAQIAIRYSNANQMYIRYYFNGLWSAWTEVITSERAFFNTDLVLPNGKGLYVRDTNGNVQLVGAINDSNLILLGDPDLPTYIRGTDVRINGNTAWHSGNDGAGSGLDADLLDGRQPSTSASANTIVQRDSSGRAKFAAPAASDDAARKAEVDAAMAAAQAAQNTANAALPASQYTASDVLEKLKTVDGAGSGLDADMLDGIHASSFLQTAGGTVSGALAIDGNLTANGGENRIKNLIVNGGYFEVESYGSQYGSGKLRTYFDANNRRWVLTANIGGTAQPLKLDLNGALLIADNGSPEGAVTAPVGSIYIRLNSQAGQVLYVKVSGNGNTGWQAIA